MLQRIQTIFMLLAFLSSLFLGISAYVGPLSFFDERVYNLMAIGFSVLIFINIFLYKNRRLQILLNNISVFFFLIMLGLLIYQSGLSSGEMNFSKKDVGLILPVFSIVFLLIANKYIKRDEALVKSVDRIR